MSFKALLDELEQLNKSMPTADGASNGGEGAGNNEGGQGAGTGAGEGAQGAAATASGAAAGGAGDDDELIKSLGLKSVTVMVDGKEQQAFDGIELAKSLAASNQKLRADLDESSQVLKSLLTTNIALAKQVAVLSKSVTAIAEQGRGRKSATVVLPDNSQSQQQGNAGMKPAEFMAKSLAAQKAGRITASEVAEAEALIGRGLQVPESIVNRVMAA